MEAGDTVRYRGEPVVAIGEQPIEPGVLGRVIAMHNQEEAWVAVWWETVNRPTFHRVDDLEVVESG